MAIAIETTRMIKTQSRDAGAVLARAFFDYPMWQWIMPDEATRLAKLTWFMAGATKFGTDYGEVETTAGAIAGNAIWLPPGNTDPPMMRLLAAGMWMAPFRLGMGSLTRFLTMLDTMKKVHHHAMPERHYYLSVLGVDPLRQGQGVGSALMQPGLARADAAHVPCYVETQGESNVRLYRRHGFEVVAEGELPDGGPRYWAMKRAAR